MSNISYHAFVLDKSDQEYLSTFVKKQPEFNLSWETIAHHVTVGMGKTSDKLIPIIGKRYSIKITHYGFIENRVIAVKVIVSNFPQDDFSSSVKFPHITLAVNRNSGAKPYESNKITHWEPLNNAKEMWVTGTLHNLDNNSNIVK